MPRILPIFICVILVKSVLSGVIFILPSNERQKPHYACPLYRFGKPALMFRADTGVLRIDYFCLA
jgi:hypothetical protein